MFSLFKVTPLACRLCSIDSRVSRFILFASHIAISFSKASLTACMLCPSLQIVTEGKSNSATGFEIVFKLVIVLSPFQSVKMFLAKIAADIRAKITKIDHITLVKWEFFSRYWIPGGFIPRL